MTRANPLFACGAWLMAILACSYRGITDVPPEEHVQAVGTLAVQMNTPAAALTPGFLTGTPDIPQATATPSDFSSAVFYFFPDDATFSGVESVGSLLDFCAPPQTMDSGSGYLLIGEFSALSGRCSSDSTDKTVHREGALIGGYDAANGLVSFRLETRRVFSPHPEGRVTAVLTFEGYGTVTGNTASGVGNFDYACSAEGELVYCIDDSTTLQLNGTMPFQLEFRP